MHRRIRPGNTVKLKNTASVHLGTICQSTGTQSSSSGCRLHTVISLTVLILIIREFIRTTHVEIRRVLNAHTLLGTPLLGGDQYNTIGRLTAVKCSCRTSFQDGNAGNVIRVEVGNTITTVDVQRYGRRYRPLIGIVDRHTIHHIKRLLVAIQRGVTPDDHTAGTAGTGIRLCRIHTCDLAGQRTPDIVHTTFRELPTLHLLDRITQTTTNLTHTKCRHHHIFQ